MSDNKHIESLGASSRIMLMVARGVSLLNMGHVESIEALLVINMGYIIEFALARGVS